MRSIAALAALALTGTLDFAAASRCKPRPSTLSSTTDMSPTDTTTATSTATETQGPRVVKNDVVGGSFSIKPADGGVPGFTVDGDADIIIGPGYKGDGSNDNGCLSMKSSNPQTGPQKRGLLGASVGVSQMMDSLSLRLPYTIRFFYFVVTAPQLDICQLNAYLGSQMFFQTWIVSFGSGVQWGQVLEQVTAAERSA
ncbi:hypothetical protein FDECE_16268, partial [Fusarium decemcellulare]